MARTGHSTNTTSGRHRARQPQSQKLMDKEILELKNYLPEWTAAKRSEKRGIFTAIARAARLFAPKVDQKQWKKRKQMYKTWLFNNKKKKERKDMIKYGRKWTPRMVVYQQKREEVLKRIEDESGVKPGDPGMFKHYQAAVKRVMAELDDDELEKAKETAEEWSNNCPPPEIQAQVARKKGPAYMEHFSNEMWRQCGMRVFVMSAWKNEKGEVLFGMHDDNEALGDGDSFMKTKDWEDIEPVWQEYAQEQFGAGARDGGRQVKGGRKRMRKPAFELEMDGEGMPLLPDITDTKLEEKKAMVRAFLTSHYRICSGKDKAVVPWSAIVHSQDDFVAQTYLPADVDLKEPSKLQNWDTTALLQFWHARQERGEGPTFLFKAWKNTDGDMVPSVISGKSPSPQARIGRKRQRVTIRRPRDSSTDSEGDTESSTHHTEVDVDDDSADRRPPLKKPRTGVSAPKGTAVPRAIPKPRQAKPAKTGALLTSRMGDLLDGLTEEATGEVKDDVEVEDRMTAPEGKRRRGKRAVVEPSARTTRSLQLVMSGAKKWLG
ncbi:hypothetical protein EV702DRAFT_1255604 [Suillus placidus]|uniref:Uncharacterized protein n=1 Tax=Suillus placidus TaxID=48579 RepID=A0A9P7A1V1_9AGAM|nr:hypothetical protein EV702DRAFT_1051852 [Suillus placidus]KAG1773757.1 hypothetical protein EV702DRAFT_1048145 [Suillus placidus]KAG1780215.1 hypothetical protein EV702DRAFT_1255604 [Suillus placidus]